MSKKFFFFIMGTSKNYFSTAILAFWLRPRRISQKVLNVAAGYACGLFVHPPYLAQKSKISLRKVVFRGALLFIIAISNTASAQFINSLPGCQLPRDDTNHPLVLSTQPFDNAANVPVNAVIAVSFSRQMDPASVNNSTIDIFDDDGKDIGSSVSFDAAAQTAALDPPQLDYDTPYKVVISTGVRDCNGNRMENRYIFSFRTTPDTRW